MGVQRLTRPELESFADTVVPDLIGHDVKLLFVGINPGLWTAAVQAHFARRGNRFYPALYRAGLIDREIDASAGYLPEDRAHLLARGIGITNLVARASARADELSPDELRE
ncbi:MAG: mismatch-specific DNA-glycosylase, partial [Actinomycetota bacterium]|nr:mismatch-specific DNA-glycosylase [Actinomycetota bacterium]